MFAPRNWFEKLTASYESFIAAHQADVNRSLDRVVEAKNQEVQHVISAKNSEISLLKEHISWLNSALEHERSRAEAAIDRLLAQTANVPPIRNADIERSVAARTLGTPLIEPEKRTAMGKIFAQVNATGEDDDSEMKPDELLASIGGFNAS